MRKPPQPESRAARALGWIDPTTRGIAPPIYPSASYQRADDGSYPGGHSYSRDQNPTFDQTEALLASLDDGAEALLFASGMAAATTLFEVLDSGDHVVAPAQMYWTIRLWLEQLAAKGRISLAFFENGDPDSLRTAVAERPTRLVWLETPSNPLCEISDIATCAEIAHAAGAIVVADGTLATPALTCPLTLGADLVMHSATKQLNGHGDVLAGALVTRKNDELWAKIRADRSYRGAVLGPFEAWLLQRGMRTLFLRVRKSAENAQCIAESLEDHAEIEEVFYPGLPHHPQHDIARRQMKGGFGPLVSFRPIGGEKRARAIAAALELFHQATSLGGVESLVEHRASVEGPGTSIPEDLLRFSIGIEDVGDLMQDLEQAIRASSTAS